MIVKNEEKTLYNCLSSVKDFVDEIIIVDTGSCDRTKEIAKTFTDKVYDFEWIDDFSAARNYSFSFASMDYILWLDADDIILPNDAKSILALKEGLEEDVHTVMFKYNTGFDKFGNVTFSFYRERLVKRSAGFKWKEPVHEYIETFNKTIRSQIAVTHAKIAKEENKQSDRNLKIYEKILAENKKLSPRGTYYYARELKDNGRYKEAIKYFDSFLIANKGWVEDNISACMALNECYKKLDDNAKALQSLLRSFCYDVPRPEACCKLGYYFKEKAMLNQSIYWFECALNYLHKDNYGFWQKDYNGYIPAIELAVCYDILKDAKNAYRYNEMAASFKPNCPSIKANREYLKKLFAKMDNKD